MMTYTNTPEDYTYCSHRLPCGVCRLTNQMCPVGSMKIEPTWTCSATASIPDYQKLYEEKMKEKYEK